MADERKSNPTRKPRPWTVRVAGLLLLLQAAGYVALTLYVLLPPDWQVGILSPPQIDAPLLGFTLIDASVLAILSGLGFLLLLRAGWLLAMALQGATLLGCLAFYFGTKPAVIFSWYLYLFNDWRSGFHGANDHQADWEMVCVYLSEWSEGELTPEWVAYAAHESTGDDLPRRWDNPELEKEGEHPVVCAGAGSRAWSLA